MQIPRWLLLVAWVVVGLIGATTFASMVYLLVAHTRQKNQIEDNEQQVQEMQSQMELLRLRDEQLQQKDSRLDKVTTQTRARLCGLNSRFKTFMDDMHNETQTRQVRMKDMLLTTSAPSMEDTRPIDPPPSVNAVTGNSSSNSNNSNSNSNSKSNSGGGGGGYSIREMFQEEEELQEPDDGGEYLDYPEQQEQEQAVQAQAQTQTQTQVPEPDEPEKYWMHVTDPLGQRYLKGGVAAANVWVRDGLQIQHQGCLETGYGVAGKDAQAGKICYQSDQGGSALNVVGAGSKPGERIVRVWDHARMDSLQLGSAWKLQPTERGMQLRGVPGANGLTPLAELETDRVNVKGAARAESVSAPKAAFASLAMGGPISLSHNMDKHPDTADAATIYLADGQVQVATDGMVHLRNAGTKGTAIQFDTADGAGDVRNPNGQMKVTRQGIMFGGPNREGRDVNSAQISAGLHVPNSLNIMGMSADDTPDTRRVDVWAEGGLAVNGPVIANGGIRLEQNVAAHPDNADGGAFYRADGQVTVATDDLIRLRHVGSKSAGIQFDPRATNGDMRNPNGQMKITRQGIMLGGPNSGGRHADSAQISAGLHVPNSLNIVGMSADDADPASRRVDILAEQGLNVHGPTVTDKVDTAEVGRLDGGDWLRVRGTPENGTAMLNGVSINQNGGLTVGEFKRVPNGNVYATGDIQGRTLIADGGSSGGVWTPAVRISAPVRPESLYSLYFGPEDDVHRGQTGMGYVKDQPNKVFDRSHGTLATSVHENDDWTLYSTGWDPVFAVQGGTGDAYHKGKLTASQLCIKDTCLTESDVKALLQAKSSAAPAPAPPVG